MKTRNFLMALCLAPCLAIGLPTFAANFAGVDVPPPLEARPVTDTHWGVQVVDPYRFLENTADAEVQKYMKAQADATGAILARIPGREALLARIREIDSDTPAVVGTIRRDTRGGLFFTKRSAADNQFKLYWRAKGGQEKMLVDPEVDAKATGKPHAIGGFSPSPDGRLLAYQISAGGGEIGVMRVIDTASGKEVTPSIDRMRSANAVWLPDGSGFFYLRLEEGYKKRPRNERFMDVKASLRRLADPAHDRVVFGNALFPEVDIGRSSAALPAVLPGTGLVAALVSHGVDPNRSLYLAELESVLAGKPRWRKVFDPTARITEVVIGGGQVFMKSALDAPRYKLLRTAVKDADLAKAEVLLAPSDAVIDDLGSTKEGLYVTRREGVVKKLYRLGYGAGAKLEAIPMPFEGNVNIVNANVEIEGVLLQISGWTRAASHFSLAAGAKRPAPLGLVAPGKYAAPPGLMAREVMVKSHDGVEIPVSILSRADIKLDGSNPVTVYGYAAYGIVDEPSWNPLLLAWLERGGVYAVVHARGGGLLGDGWRRAGWKTTKPNTWKDGIAAAEWLITSGYTTRKQLSIYGGSAGGIFAGRALTERPELFSAAAIGVGNTDSVRSETRANGAANIPEYGTVTIEEEFRGLLAMSPYANVVPGTAYPAVMLEHGVNDSRVDVWITLKMGTRLAAATSSGKPVLMRLEYDGGHGVGATRSQQQGRTADRYAFFLWQAGVAGFQPVQAK